MNGNELVPDDGNLDEEVIGLADGDRLDIMEGIIDSNPLEPDDGLALGLLLGIIKKLSAG